MEEQWRAKNQAEGACLQDRDHRLISLVKQRGRNSSLVNSHLLLAF